MQLFAFGAGVKEHLIAHNLDAINYTCITLYEIHNFCPEACFTWIASHLVVWRNIVVECQVAAEEAEGKMTEMTKAVDELKKLLKQATSGEIHLITTLSDFFR